MTLKSFAADSVLEMFETTVFDLDEIDNAIARAAARRGAFKPTVIQPRR
jgi:hypothetical protein